MGGEKNKKIRGKINLLYNIYHLISEKLLLNYFGMLDVCKNQNRLHWLEIIN